MIDKGSAGSYNHSHKKSVKSFAKVLDIKHRIGQNSQLHSFTASQLHSFTASQLRGSCAQIKQSNTNKFTHIKNRKERKALSFAQLRKGIIGMSYGLRLIQSRNTPKP